MYFCNYIDQDTGNYCCTFSFISKCWTNGKIRVQYCLSHSHTQPSATQKLLRSEKTEIIESLLGGRSPQYIYENIVPTFDSVAAKCLPKDYIVVLENKIIKQRFAERDVDGFIKFHNMLMEKENVIEIVMKLPGVKIQEIPNYPNEDILFAFTFQINLDWLQTNSLKHIMVDTIYSFSKYGLKLILFFY